MRAMITGIAVVWLLGFAACAVAAPCVLPDNGAGTVNLPPSCSDGYQGTMTIVEGLPPGSTIVCEATLTDFFNVFTFPGGTLGGEVQQFEASLIWSAQGTGDMLGFQRTLAIPVVCEVHTGPRNPGDPVQTFDQELFFLQGQLFGDPDFCELIVTAGSNNGLPSPGSTTLARMPSGDFNVDSFFDITYRIDFQGCPGGMLDGMAGSTIGGDRFTAGETYYPYSCVMPDNGTGTIDLPPECPDGYMGNLITIDGLPVGSTIEGEASIIEIHNPSRYPGGTLGGEVVEFEATLRWNATGTGDLTGFARTLWIPVWCEVHYGLRNWGDPVQTFPQELVVLHGQLFGDPDFCELIVRAGSAYGLPSPGSTTLTRLPDGNFNVDSFFDITYQIEFEGCPGSILEGMAGITQDTRRYQAGELYHDPDPPHSCILPDNGLGTIDLPPECPDGYQGHMTIVDGLPPGTTIECESTLTGFHNIVRFAGGMLGGEVQQFDASLVWVCTGTGDMTGFNRNLSLPVQCEVHTGPRNPGDPVQTFPQEMYFLRGELFGDPDFCELIVRAGSDNGLPSPGETTLTELPSGDFAVDSFFDITYQIEFEGCPGSPLEDLAGITTGTERFQAGEPLLSGVNDSRQPQRFVLHQNSPNPFNPTTEIQFEVPAGGGLVQLDIYDIRGSHVRNLVNGFQTAGLKSVAWNGKDGNGSRTASGVYLYILNTHEGRQIRKMAIIK
ncbi:MAG: FlgD immunoglobulin-like domain containing protein [bacterium]